MATLEVVRRNSVYILFLDFRSKLHLITVRYLPVALPLPPPLPPAPIFGPLPSGPTKTRRDGHLAGSRAWPLTPDPGNSPSLPCCISHSSTGASPPLHPPCSGWGWEQPQMLSLTLLFFVAGGRTLRPRSLCLPAVHIFFSCFFFLYPLLVALGHFTVHPHYVYIISSPNPVLKERGFGSSYTKSCGLKTSSVPTGM